MDSAAEPKRHEWSEPGDWLPGRYPWSVCKSCGLVRNSTSDTRPCKGPVKIGLRDEAPPPQDPIASPEAEAFCKFCVAGSRSLPIEKHGVVAYVHTTTGGETLVCGASALKILEDLAASR